MEKINWGMALTAFLSSFVTSNLILFVVIKFMKAKLEKLEEASAKLKQIKDRIEKLG